MIQKQSMYKTFKKEVQTRVLNKTITTEVYLS